MTTKLTIIVVTSPSHGRLIRAWRGFATEEGMNSYIESMVDVECGTTVELLSMELYSDIGEVEGGVKYRYQDNGCWINQSA